MGETDGSDGSVGSDGSDELVGSVGEMICSLHNRNAHLVWPSEQGGIVLFQVE